MMGQPDWLQFQTDAELLGTSAQRFIMMRTTTFYGGSRIPLEQDVHLAKIRYVESVSAFGKAAAEAAKAFTRLGEILIRLVDSGAYPVDDWETSDDEA